MRFDHYRLRTEGAQGGAITVAHTLAKDGTRLLVGMSFCAPQDTFNKKKGRNIAKSRLLSNPLHFVLADGPPIEERNLFLILFGFLVNFPDQWTVTDTQGQRFKTCSTSAMTGPGGRQLQVAVDGHPMLEEEDLEALTVVVDVETLGAPELAVITPIDPEPKGWVFRCIPQWAGKYMRQIDEDAS